MSALPPKADICATSLDYFVGNREHARWDGEAECLGGLEVDRQLELGRSQDRQVGGLLALENPAGVDADLTPLAKPRLLHVSSAK
jgi:hypothetical protein